MELGRKWMRGLSISSQREKLKSDPIFIAELLKGSKKGKP